MKLFNTSYFNIHKGLFLSLFLSCNIFCFSQTNEKIKAKEEPQIKAISKTNKPTLEKKRQDYLTQTREQRLGRGKEKGKSKAQKETEYLNNTSGQRNFKGKTPKSKDNSKSLAKDIKNNSANIKTGTPQEREYTQVTNNKGARNFVGKTKTADSKYKGEVKKDMGTYSGSDKYLTKGEKEANYLNKSKGERSFQGNSKPIQSKYKEETKKNMGQYTGDQKYLTRGEKEAIYIKNSKGTRTHQGNIKPDKLAHIERKAENKETMSKYATGDLKYQTKGQKEADYIARTKGIREHQGNIKTNKLAHLEKKDANKREMEGYQGNVKPGQYAHLLKKEENKKEMEKFSTGDLKYMTKGQKEMAYLKRTSAMREYQGKIKIGNLAHLQKREEIKADMEKFSTGDINLRDLEQRAKERRKRDKAVASFSGSIRTKDLEKWGKSIRKREKEIANFQGNIKVEKRKKGQHPSAAYRGGKIANSYTQKEKMRKKMLKKYGRKGDIDMPAHLKDQPKKAKYNRDESEIWW